MPQDRLEERLSTLRRLSGEDAATRIPELRRALRDRSNVAVAKAADVAAECGDDALIPDMLEVYDALFGEDAKERDPLARAKESIARALRTLGHREPAPFVRGVHHVQLEPSWAKLVDTAGALRCACAHALVDTQLSPAAALRELVPHLVDAITAVRADTVRAIAQIGGDESMLLLRLKAYAGDDEAEVIGECFTAIVEREPHDAVAFIVPFLDAGDRAVRGEAAAALALSRDPAALDALRVFLDGNLEHDLREAAIVACAACPQPAVVELLLDAIARGDRVLGAAAIRALADSRFGADAGVRDRARAVAKGQRLESAYRAAFTGATDS